ncbi:hypothetical protein BDV38DRAFT_279103 [Aspergillus pseudotamarii]|uniref:Uncharacterized protein n=1 Tax=Aspergillus pseudotamarii TaxID=132259 RepID=A0A5N6T685_ASPPS|nr:uncharacterized protein BDV38DRAFT_279103 [Aspergillus pseudotamarii]KAE8141759.1 hypothetical protein BDV38DRAFT_279103 [Aspergillus pseudotamarii]
MPFTIEPAHLWKAIALMLAWVVISSSRPVFLVVFDWLSIHIKHGLERLWCAFARRGGGPEARPDQTSQESVGKEEHVRSDSPGNGLPAKRLKITMKRWVERLRYWRGLSRGVNLEEGMRRRSRSARPAPRHPSQFQSTQAEASGGAGLGDLNALTSSLLPTTAGVDPTGGQT